MRKFPYLSTAIEISKLCSAVGDINRSLDGNELIVTLILFYGVEK